MKVTDEPMPGVQQPGSRGLWLIGARHPKNERTGETKFITGFGPHQLELARRTAFDYASEWDEVVVLDATISYRAWQDKEDVA